MEYSAVCAQTFTVQYCMNFCQTLVFARTATVNWMVTSNPPVHILFEILTRFSEFIQFCF